MTRIVKTRLFFSCLNFYIFPTRMKIEKSRERIYVFVCQTLFFRKIMKFSTYKKEKKTGEWVFFKWALLQQRKNSSHVLDYN